MNSKLSTDQIVHEATRLSRDALAAGQRVTTAHAKLLKTRSGSAANVLASVAYSTARDEFRALERKRDAAWALANSRR